VTPAVRISDGAAGTFADEAEVARRRQTDDEWAGKIAQRRHPLAERTVALEVLDESVLPVLMDLRHNAAQLGSARDGKMV
jgi:hypothetical protein